MKRTLPERLIGLLAMACILVAARNAAHAQGGVFQSTYGHGNEMGYDVEYTPVDGGSISSGTSYSFGIDGDVYVVKTNACGTIIWSNTYDLGGNDFGAGIELTSDGGYIVTGSTENKNHCCNHNGNDAFLLKLDPTGKVQWARTFGGPDNDFAEDVVQNTNDGGYVIAGGTYNFGWNTPSPTTVLGWLIRTDATGQLLWSRAYGPLDRAHFSSVALANGGTEILAVGTSEFGLGSNDIFAIRVQDADGSFGASGWAYHMQPLSTSVGTRIRECANGNIIIAGSVQSPTTGLGAGYLLEVQGNGTYVNDRTYELSAGGTGLRDVRELPSGDFVVCGMSANPSGGFGGNELLLMEINRATLNHNWATVHGGPFFDEGTALAIAPPTGSSSYDIYAVGSTSSFAVGSYLYLLRSTPGSGTGCHEASETLFNDSWGQTPLAVNFPIPFVKVGCNVNVATKPNADQIWLCFTCMATRKSHDEEPGDIGDTHDGGDNRTSDVKSGENAGGVMMLQPNPVINGAHFILTYHSPSLKPVIVTIADLSGRIVYTATEDFPMAVGQKSIETKGWANGTYMVRMDCNGISETKRIVVIGK